MYPFIRLKKVRLKLGAEYYLGQKRLRFIQPTPKGFNFLNLKTHKCVLKRHLYPYKKYDENKNGKVFLIVHYINLVKVKINYGK